MKSQNFKKYVFVIFLILIAIIERLWFDLGPNVELVTTATILATIILGKKQAATIPLFILGFTDMFIGNTNIMLFTWSAFTLETLVISLLTRRLNFKKKKLATQLFTSSTIGVGASLWFFLWTNFGVWLLDSWKMYPKTFSGLIRCYFAGLPFLKLNLFSNMFFLPLGLVTWKFLDFQKRAIFPPFFSFALRIKNKYK